jgi:hypothetical protein
VQCAEAGSRGEDSDRTLPGARKNPVRRH